MKKAAYALMTGLFFTIMASLAAACDSASCPLPHVRAWDRLAEKSFALPKGLASVVMTPEEWLEEKEKMQGMAHEERQKYKKEMQLTLFERAKEKGIAVPAAKTRIKSQGRLEFQASGE